MNIENNSKNANKNDQEVIIAKPNSGPPIPILKREPSKSSQILSNDQVDFCLHTFKGIIADFQNQMKSFSSDVDYLSKNLDKFNPIKSHETEKTDPPTKQIEC